MHNSEVDSSLNHRTASKILPFRVLPGHSKPSAWVRNFRFVW